MLFCFKFIWAQHVTEKRFENVSLTRVVVDADKITRLELETTDVDDVTVVTNYQGEYMDNLVTIATLTNKVLNIKVKFLPSFILPDDKLAAHKVLSVKVKIMLPANKYLSVSGNDADVLISGSYKNVQVVLNSGNCIFKDLKGNGTVDLFSGDVILNNYRGKVNWKTDYGSAIVNEIVENKHFMVIHTVKGNIYVNHYK